MTATIPSASQAAAAVRVSDIVMMDAVALNSAIHSRQVSCVEVMTAYLDHIVRLNPKRRSTHRGPSGTERPHGASGRA
jgi:hypothetical protein